MAGELNVSQFRMMSEIAEDDETDEHDGAREDEGDHRGRLRPRKRRYTKNWDSLIQFDDDNNLDKGDRWENDLSKQIPTDNLILKDMTPPPRPDKGSPTATDDSQSVNTEIDNENLPRMPPPIPKKRTNLMRPISDDGSRYDDVRVTQSSDVRVEVDPDSYEVIDKRVSYEEIGDFTLPKRPIVDKAPGISVDRRFGPGGRLFVNNPATEGINSASDSSKTNFVSADAEKEPRLDSATMSFTNGAFQPDSQETAPEAAPNGENSVKDRRESALEEEDQTAVHWDEDVKDSSESAKNQEVSDLDRLDWDVFRAYQYDSNSYASEKLYKVGAKLLKIAFVIISFLTILSCLVTSKLSILFATSNIHPEVGFFLANDSCGIPAVYEIRGCKSREVVRWLWCILLCMCVPYAIVFLQSMWKICFKKKPKPTTAALFFTLFMESLHTAGLVMLFFIVLPKVDMLQALFLMNASALFPSFFKLFIRPKDENRATNVFLDVVSFLTQLVPVVCYPLFHHPPDSAADSGPNSTNPYCSANHTASTTCSSDENGNMTVAVEECLLEEYDRDLAIYTPIALLLVSCCWWQNYVDKDLRMRCAKGLRRLSKEVKRGRTKIYAVVAVWKMVLSFSLFLAIARFHVLDESDMMAFLFGTNEADLDSKPFHDHTYMYNSDRTFENDWLLVFAANILAGFVCYVISLNAIQAKVQKSTYSLAIILSTPVTLLIGALGLCSDCEQGYNGMATAFNLNDLYWNCFGGVPYFADGVTGRDILLLLGIAGWIGLFIVTRHLWSPKSERLAKSSRIFVQPFYCGMLLEESFALNRSRHDKHKERRRHLPQYRDHVTPGENADRPMTIRHGLTSDRQRTQEEINEDEDDVATHPVASVITEDPLYSRADKSEPMIFICATMWHENEQEMIQMLKSIMRLDRDQATRRLTREYFHANVPDYYSFEVHIFFDDAFNKYVPGDPEITVNRFVAQFVKVIDQAATYVHAALVEIEPPKKVPTPYGGKLIFSLPGGNTMCVHLKDKQKIRHRKRWSQVMYMYYLLGHRLWDKPIRRSVKEEVAYNTYILTLDGDVDFKPEAVILLVDLMRRNFGVGAACGRIHPEGNGPMVWYQKFEYAISHWLQKTTEHVLGCVLCSPGCFSLFRASALMDDNVMKTYSKTAEEALHYVQYDQGEDRWLCTLLLQRGYRVEYSAAADALTYAPESFNEFFNQRRRWTPSTFANILDLLSTGRATAKRNQNISILYIIYQAGLMFSSVVGPATILLMVVSAFSSVFRSLSISDAFFIVFVPVAVFFALCMLAKQGIQLAFAALLGALFATSQMVVLVGLIIGIAEDGLCSPTSWFLLGTTAIFVISGIFHPQEVTVLIHGLLYFLLIPTMYLLLIIYSLCNLHVVSWGTREVVQTTVEKEKLKQRELELAVQQVGGAASNNGKDGTGILGKIGGLLGNPGASGGAEDGWTWSCGDVFRCLCCPRPGESPTDKKITKLENQIAILTTKISRLVDKGNENDESTSESEPDETKPLMAKENTSSTSSQNSDGSDTRKTEEDDTTSASDEKGDDSGTQEQIKYSETKPYWTQDFNSVGKGPVGTISEKEEDFWKHLIRRYLLPIDKNPEREERIKKELLALRNKAVIAFFMINILFMVLFMSLAATDVVKPPEGTMGNETNLPSSSYYINFYCTNPVSGDTEMHFIEPIGFAFLMVFGSFLVIQFIGMLFHRLFSLLQVVSSEVLCRKRKANEPKSYLELTEQLSKMGGDPQTPDTLSVNSSVDSLDVSESPEQNSDRDDDDDESDGESQKNYKQVIKRLNWQPRVFRTMDKTFARRFLALNQQVSKVTLPEEPPSVPVRNAPMRPRLPSIFQRPANLSVLQPRGAFERRQSVAANNLVMDLKRKQTEIFTPEKEALIRQRFKISDKEIKREETRMRRLIAGASILSTDEEEDTESAQARSQNRPLHRPV